MFDIEIANEQSFLEIDEERLREVVRLTLREEKVAAARLSLALVDNSTIRVLNARHLGHDDDTDVLSFLLESSPPDSQRELRGSGKGIEGEIVVSAEKAVESADAFGWSPIEEALLYVVHGVLHLLGYDDTTDAERQIMRGRERAILQHWNLVPVYDDTAVPLGTCGRGLPPPLRKISEDQPVVDVPACESDPQRGSEPTKSPVHGDAGPGEDVSRVDG